MKKIIVLGGGVSGLASAILLARRSKFEVLLVDKNNSFLNSLRLHQTFHEPLSNFQKKYDKLANDFKFRFLQKEINFTRDNLLKWKNDSCIEEIGEKFDYLILSTGAIQYSPDAYLTFTPESDFLGLNDFIQETWFNKIDKILSAENISFVGGGASSIQFIFELYSLLEKNKRKPQINFITSGDRILPSLPVVFHQYIQSKFKNKNTKLFQSKKLIHIDRDFIKLESIVTGSTIDYPSDITFLFPGVKASPFRLDTNEFGQILIDNLPLHNIYSAGDCSFFRSTGDNSMSAQIAVRKARTVSQNIINQSENYSIKSFNYKELGYFISMGQFDGVGWMLFPMNVLFGPPAFVVKELIEKQFELFMTGLDTYIDF